MLRINKFSGFDFSKHSGYEDLTSYLLDTNCTVHNLGASANGEAVYGLSVGDLSKPMILIDGGMHGGHEWYCTHWVKEFIERIANPLNNANKPIIEKLKAQFCFFAIPCLSPYGYTDTSYVNANGVNLNRNFPNGWENFIMTEPFDSQYKGTEPLSEPESQIIANMLNEYRVIGYINTHTWGANMGGLFENSSTMLKNKVFIDDIKKTISFSNQADIQSRFLYSYPHTGWVTNYAGIQDSKSGEETISIIFEVGGGETNIRKSEIGMTGLFAFSVHLYEWFTTRKVILN